MPGYNANLQIESCAIDEARSLLAADGWQDTNQNAIVDKTINGKLLELKLIFYTSGELSQKIGLLLKDACEKVGIEIELIQKDFPLVMKENLSTGNYDIVPSVASTDILMENPYDWYHSDNIGSSNLSNYSNPEADKLIDIIRTAKDNTSLQKVFGQLQQIIYDDVAILYLYSPDQRIVVREPWEPVFTLKRPGYKANLFVSN
jgi:ABC-type transport system substrate-binding protein